MSTHTSVTKRIAAVVIAAAISASVCLAAAPAQAAPMQPSELVARTAKLPRIGPVTGLTATASKPADVYRVTAKWDSLAGATTYDVSLTAGTFSAKARVTQPTWTTDVKASVNTTVTIRVVPVAAVKSKRVAKSISLVLPDLTAPVGEYKLDLTGTTATVTQVLLSDDVTPQDNIERAIDWLGTGNFAPWPTGTTLSFDYGGVGIWKPLVRLADQARKTCEPYL